MSDSIYNIKTDKPQLTVMVYYCGLGYYAINFNFGLHSRRTIKVCKLSIEKGIHKLYLWALNTF